MKARSLHFGDSGAQTWDSQSYQASPGSRITVRDLLAPQGPHSPAQCPLMPLGDLKAACFVVATTVGQATHCSLHGTQSKDVPALSLHFIWPCALEGLLGLSLTQFPHM